jgi:hypothetical protein
MQAGAVPKVLHDRQNLVIAAPTGSSPRHRLIRWCLTSSGHSMWRRGPKLAEGE